MSLHLYMYSSSAISRAIHSAIQANNPQHGDRDERLHSAALYLIAVLQGTNRTNDADCPFAITALKVLCQALQDWKEHDPNAPPTDEQDGEYDICWIENGDEEEHGTMEIVGLETGQVELRLENYDFLNRPTVILTCHELANLLQQAYGPTFVEELRNVATKVPHEANRIQEWCQEVGATLPTVVSLLQEIHKEHATTTMDGTSL